MFTLMVGTLIIATAAAYPMRNGQIQTSSGTCASIGYTTGCCPPDMNCKATDGECYCGADCHTYDDCCSDIMDVCPSNPSTCTELGFTDRCCDPVASMGKCEVDTGDVSCSCQVSCYLDQTCCNDIGCVPRTCTEAGLDPGCCEGNCTVHYDTNEFCYCDEGCRDKGDCCEDVNKTKDCGPRCSLPLNTRIQNLRLQRPNQQYSQTLKRQQLRMENTVPASNMLAHHNAAERSMRRERIVHQLDAKFDRVEGKKLRSYTY